MSALATLEKELEANPPLVLSDHLNEGAYYELYADGQCFYHRPDEQTPICHQRAYEDIPTLIAAICAGLPVRQIRRGAVLPCDLGVLDVWEREEAAGERRRGPLPRRRRLTETDDGDAENERVEQPTPLLVGAAVAPGVPAYAAAYYFPAGEPAREPATAVEQVRPWTLTVRLGGGQILEAEVINVTLREGA